MSIEDRVIGILSELAGIEASAIRIDDDLRLDLGLDSIRAMELLAFLSDDLGVEVGVEETADLRTVSQVLALVRSRGHDAV
jgi:acyl carrier protein